MWTPEWSNLQMSALNFHRAQIFMVYPYSSIKILFVLALDEPGVPNLKGVCTVEPLLLGPHLTGSYHYPTVSFQILWKQCKVIANISPIIQTSWLFETFGSRCTKLKEYLHEPIFCSNESRSQISYSDVTFCLQPSLWSIPSQNRLLWMPH